MLEITQREPICGRMYFKKAFDFHRPSALLWASDFPRSIAKLLAPIRKLWDL